MDIELLLWLPIILLTFASIVRMLTKNKDNTIKRKITSIIVNHNIK